MALSLRPVTHGFITQNKRLPSMRWSRLIFGQRRIVKLENSLSPQYREGETRDISSHEIVQSKYERSIITLEQLIAYEKVLHDNKTAYEKVLHDRRMEVILQRSLLTMIIVAFIVSILIATNITGSIDKEVSRNAIGVAVALVTAYVSYAVGKQSR